MTLSPPDPIQPRQSTLWTLLQTVVGFARTERLFASLQIHPSLLRSSRELVSRAELAQALAMLLFADVQQRVPMALAYVRGTVCAGQRIVLDHGALRTVAAHSGALPPGDAAFRRILEPLGYEVRDVYPLPALGMTGRAYAHRDLPADIAQYFVSELHPERFSPAFQQAVQRVIASSRDPLPPTAVALLELLAAAGELPVAAAAALLPDLLACFDRQHEEPRWADYQTLLAESKEMAWIATEGNAFNHATDRVADVELVAARQRQLGRPMKPAVEVSASGRVRQTAFRAALVERLFRTADGALMVCSVPGSFHEFITRAEESPGVLDLRFDSGNATAIFQMTAAVAGD